MSKIFNHFKTRFAVFLLPFLCVFSGVSEKLHNIKMQKHMTNQLSFFNQILMKFIKILINNF